MIGAFEVGNLLKGLFAKYSISNGSLFFAVMLYTSYYFKYRCLVLCCVFFKCNKIM